mmetsp:Transcript_3232/g.7364  ORF Transcript_3232/g.7364 Transcript_3232/m.7364 type:complete len:831 (-) Transcript_3232:87-2579(-)|eukprot:CAMPEP_0201194280 /NCGR_PEP_ID=MMETSP0851-20130426/148806_1 /ASSEMBLY_ACC=CAM_ASM_000631 /TAXON_ID=183588 /ORGANISM="Pseudo-nitzschia fraudulenta, Strain WWA7" /LENGTH=830 /DNA_ID=CAMNT_0047480927 /DNA_START=50 /DNA_END=2542 /DNA_ORIENTATION=+
MSNRIDNNGNDMVEGDNDTGNDSGGNGAQQSWQQQPQVRRIYQGRQPPRGFRFAHHPVHPNNGGEVRPNGGPLHQIVDMNPNELRNIPLDGAVNENPNANRNRNVQRVRLNGRFVVRQQQRMPNPLIRSPQQQRQHQRQYLQRQHQQDQQQQQRRQMGTRDQIRLNSNDSFRIGPNGPVRVRRVEVQVEPLIAQPLSDLAVANNNTNPTTNWTRNDPTVCQRVEDPPQYERYKCEICYEYMNDPVGCGKCSSRFCRKCLQKVFDSDQQKQQVTKCPVCRCEYEQLVPDVELYGRNRESVPTLPCRYISSGCPERSLLLYEIAQHEQVCEHVRMRCRYAHYGCRWIGKRGLIQAHEEFGCKLAPIGDFIQQFRETKAGHSTRLNIVEQQAAGAVRMSHVLRQTYTRDNQRKSLLDTLRLFQYCHAITSLTPHFLMTKDLWVSYWRNNESRAAVINFCICVPFLAAAIGVIGRGTSSFFELFEEASPGRTLSMLAKALEGVNINLATISNPAATQTIIELIRRLQDAQTDELLLTTFLGVCVGILGFLVIVLNFVDTKSNISWDKISIPWLGRFPLVGDVMAITIFTLILAMMEYHESNMRALVLWFFIVVTTTFFPALVFSISHYTARLVTRMPRPALFNLMEMARLVEPCMFGLRFSLLVVYFDVKAALDASVVLSLVPQTSRLYLKNSFFEKLPRTACVTFLVAKSAFWALRVQSSLFGGELDWKILKSAVTVENAQKMFTSSSDGVELSKVLDRISTSLLATASLVVTNRFINVSFDLGITVGDYIATISHQELRPEGIARGTSKEYSPVGLFAFGSWVVMIALLVHV